MVPGQFADDLLFRPIEPQFAQYPRETWEFVAGKAELLDPDANQLVVANNDGTRRTIQYDGLAIATGARARDGMPWKEVGTTEDTKKTLHDLQDQIKNSKSVLVAGGGASGIEIVGEIGFEYAQKGLKDVYFVTEKALPLDDLHREDLRKDIKRELEKLGVKVIPNTRVGAVKADHSAKGRKTLTLTDASGSTKQMTVDTYLPAFGVHPNSEFAPAKIRDDAGYVLQDDTLRVPGYPNIFVVGDVGNLETSTVVHAEAQLIHVAKTIQQYMTGSTELDKYTPDPTLVTAVTLGRSRGAGQFKNWKLFSLMIWWMKGRHLGTDKAADFVSGKRSVNQTKW